MPLPRKGSSNIIGDFELGAELHKGMHGPLWAVAGRGGPHAGRALLGRRVDRQSHPAAIEELEDAAAAAADLAHPGIVAVLTSVADEGELVIVSEEVEGDLLRSVLRYAGLARKPAPAPVVLRIALDLVEVLAYVHDLEVDDGTPVLAAPSPDNVHVGADGRARLLEPVVSFVVAGLPDWQKEPARVAYAAPESLAKAGPAGPQCDLFSLGVLLWELLRNRPLFAGTSYNVVASRVQSADIKRADALKPAGGEPVPAALADVVERLLDRDLGGRYATADELLGALRGIGFEPASREEVAAYLRSVAGRSLDTQRAAFRKLGVSIPPPGEAPHASAVEGGEYELPTGDDEPEPISLHSLPPSQLGTTMLGIGDDAPNSKATASADDDDLDDLFGDLTADDEPPAGGDDDASDDLFAVDDDGAASADVPFLAQEDALSDAPPPSSRPRSVIDFGEDALAPDDPVEFERPPPRVLVEPAAAPAPRAVSPPISPPIAVAVSPAISAADAVHTAAPVSAPIDSADLVIPRQRTGWPVLALAAAAIAAVALAVVMLGGGDDAGSAATGTSSSAPATTEPAPPPPPPPPPPAPPAAVATATASATASATAVATAPPLPVRRPPPPRYVDPKHPGKYVPGGI